jgi:glycosyltransferase 2 family protein
MAMITVAHPRRTTLHLAALAACVGLLAYQMRDIDPATMFAGLNVLWLAAAVIGLLVSLAAAAHNISAFAPLRLRAVDTLRAQLAIGGLRVVTPSAVSTPAIGTRLLTRKGLSTPAALTVVAVAQTAQLLMTIVVVGAIALLASGELELPSGTGALIIAGAVVFVAVIAVVLRRIPAVRRLADQAVAAVRSIAAHLRANPVRVVTGLAASAVLTLAHIGAFVCCVQAVGGSASVLALTAVYLAAASAGSLIPTPGGVGAVESAMISGLIAAGLSPQTAAAAALLSRLVTVWLPAVPGLFALRALRRDGLL